MCNLVWLNPWVLNHKSTRSALFCPLEIQYDPDHHTLFPGTSGLLTCKEYQGTLPKGDFKAQSPSQTWLLPVTDESVLRARLCKTELVNLTTDGTMAWPETCTIPGSPASQGYIRFYYYHFVWDINKIVLCLESTGASLVGSQKEPASPGAKESDFILLQVLSQ